MRGPDKKRGAHLARLMKELKSWVGIKNSCRPFERRAESVKRSSSEGLFCGGGGGGKSQIDDINADDREPNSPRGNEKKTIRFTTRGDGKFYGCTSRLGRDLDPE